MSILSARRVLVVRLFPALSLALLLPAARARADIFRWDNGQLIPGTQGITPAPAIDLSNWNTPSHNLNFAALGHVDLQHAAFRSSWLVSADFSSSNLAGASFGMADLTNANFALADLTGVNFQPNILVPVGAPPPVTHLNGANFTGAVIANADFAGTTGFAANQLYATASYAAHDLHGISLANLDIAGWNLAQQDLTSAFLWGADVTGVDFTGATISHAFLAGGLGFAPQQLYSTASYQQHSLQGINFSNLNLTGWNFAQQDLSNSYLSSNLTHADFGNATVTGASFDGATGFTADQLYSTASYGQHALMNIGFYGLDLTGWNLGQQDLSGADFRNAVLRNVNFGGAIIDRCNLSYSSGFTPDQLYATGSYAHHDLSGVNLSEMSMANWNFAGQDLSQASFWNAWLQGANFSGAIIRLADFGVRVTSLIGVQGSNYGTGIGLTAAQLYSTASYAQRDLSGIRFDGADMPGWNFDCQNLANASFFAANLTNANLSGANVTNVHFSSTNLSAANFTGAIINGAWFDNASGFTAAQLYSTASYAQHDLHGVILYYRDMTGWNFAGQNLTSASLYLGNVTSANFTGAIITNLDLGWTTGFTAEQLYSTASYARRDLTGVQLVAQNLSGWDFNHQTLRRAYFNSSDLTNATFAGADLTGACFYESPTLSNTNFSDSDLRGAVGWLPASSTITTNTIRPDGLVEGLDLSAHETWTIRDHPIPVTVITSATATGSAIVQFVLEDDWTSPVIFAAGIKPKLKGTLELDLAPDVNPAVLVGHTFDLFQWNDTITPGQRFSKIDTAPGLIWDLSELYTTGEVTLVAAPGALDSAAASVPEPTAIALLLLGVVPLATRRRSRKIV